jgi:Na+-transporting NADH:ubiquinone oxidoreductase subunit C
MSDHRKSFVAVGVLCVVCSMLITAASSGLRGYQLRNMNLDRQKNLLRSVGLIDDQKKYPADEIESLYRKNIRSFYVGSDGHMNEVSAETSGQLPIYLYMPENEIIAYIVPIDARGLWGRIKGYLAIDSDGTTITGFTVYKHQETPGLGGEIERRWFQKNFEGKKIVDQEGSFVSVGIARGLVEDRVPADRQIHYVDGISGATLTGRYLEASLKDILMEYEPVSVRFRKQIPLEPAD